MKKMILGVGNRLKSDDGAGSILAGRMENSQWYAVDGADIPENFTGIVRREKPDLLVIVDVTDLQEAPGTFRRLPVTALSDESGFNTHTGPLTGLISRLQNYSKEIVFVGIQPETVEFGEELSPRVSDAVEDLISILTSGTLVEIPMAEGF